MRLRKVVVLFAVLLLLFLTTTAVLAAQTTGGTVVESGETVNNEIVLFGEDLTVQEGATVTGDVVLFGGNAVIAGAVTGDVVLFGGNAEVTGTVTGDIVLFGGDLTPGDTAVFTGDCALLGGHLDESAANCETIPLNPAMMAAFTRIAPRADQGTASGANRPAESVSFGRLAGLVGQTLLMALLAFGVASAMPDRLTRVAQMAQRKPMASGVVGLLTAVAVPSLIFLLTLLSTLLLIVCVGILGYPIVFALTVGLVAAMLIGWVAIGSMTGRWLAERFNLGARRLPVTAALGTAVLTLGIGSLSFVPFIIGEWMLNIIVGSIGLGAAALTRFGSRPFLLGAGYKTVIENPISEDPDKITAVLETLPVDEPADWKGS